MSATLALPLGEREVLEALRREAHPLTGDHRDYDALLGLIGDARIVLLGEASHGTHEFYRERARITKRLIAEHGFTAVAIEGDWPDAYRVNRYVAGRAPATPTPRRRWAAFAVSRPGCGETPTCSTSSAGCAPTTSAAITRSAQGRLLRPGPLQPRRLDGGGDRLPRRAGPGRGRARTGAVRVPAAVRRRERRLRPGGAARRRRAVPAARDRAARRAAPPRRRIPAARRARRRGRVLLRRAERRRGRRTPRSTTARCSATAPAPGTCATGTWPTRSTS